jgi:CHAT domain-containing protein
MVVAQGRAALAQVDPAARAIAVEKFPLYQQAATSGNWDAFNAAFTVDPVMTRKVFLTAVLYSGEQMALDPAVCLEWYFYSRKLAELIESRFSDSGAMAIILAVDSKRPYDHIGRMMVSYAVPLYPEMAAAAYVPLDPATQKYGEFEFRPANWSAEGREASVPLFTVFRRLQLTQGYACLSEGIKQAELAKAVIKQHEDWLAEHGDPTNLQGTLSFFQTSMDAFRAATLAELGLLSEATAQLPGLLGRQEDRSYRSGVLLSCARTALALGKTDQAASFLQQARTKVNQGFVPPPLHFALLTADYQLRRQTGYNPSASQRAKDFQATWRQAFEGYRPFERVQADGYWYFGRKATRYWLSQLEPGSPEAEKICLDLIQLVQQWYSKFQDYSLANPTSSAEDWFFNPEHEGNFLTTRVGLFDVWMAAVETLPVGSPSRTGFVPLFEPGLVKGEEWAGSFTDTGEWPFSIVDSGLLLELRGRLNLLKAQEASRPPEERVDLASKGVDLIRKGGDPEANLLSLLAAGKTLQGLGRSDLAIAKWKEALDLAERLSYVEKAMQAASLLANEYSQQKNWQEAAVYAEKTSQKVEESVVLVANNVEASRQLALTSERVTEVSVKAAAQANDPKKALAALVRAKDTQSATAQVRGQTQAQAEVVAVQRQQQEVTALSVQVEKLEAVPASKSRDELLQKTQKLLADTRADFVLKGRELRARYPDLYSRVLRFDPLDLPDVQKMLPAEAAVIQYFPTQDGLYVFLVTRESFSMRLVPVSEKELDESITTFVRAIRRFQNGDATLEAESKALYGHLIEPCLAVIEGKSILVLIPAGRLNILPFACLTGPTGAPLIESKLILELAKPTDFLRISLSPPRKVESVVAFANATGDLPAAAIEGDQIAAMFPGSKLFKGKEATRKNFFDFGAKGQVLHLATHGESNSENSLTNFLRMSGDEKVAQEEIFALPLDETSIVTLSACNTAIGDNLDSRFVASLAEAFWLGGSQSVIASLWSVNDASTGLLMIEFYQGLRDGKGKAQALKEAQLTVRSTPGFEHPYFWAGFMLFGDWR